MQLILASGSPYRRALLQQAGLHFAVESPRVDEEELKRQGPREPRELTVFLAREKAKSVLLQKPEALVIGSDQVAVFHGEILGKPKSQARAEEQLSRLQGQTHELITALVILTGEQQFVHVDITRLRMRPLSPAEIKAYVAIDQPLDCAGSYKIEKAGALLLDHIRGEDPTAIQGLPMMALARGLKTLQPSQSHFWGTL